MKTVRIISKLLFFAVLFFDIAVFGTMIYLNQNLGEDFKIQKGETLSINSPLPVTALYNGKVLSADHTENNSNISIDLKMFGVIPVTKANVQVVDEFKVALLGQPFGMKLYTEGVLVVDFTDIVINGKKFNPARDAGLKKGDYILSVNGKSLSVNEDLIEAVENSNGEKLNLKVSRNSNTLNINVTPIMQEESGDYKIGIWVRDSGAGIGTLTFYSPAYNVICGLGHGVSDEDTDKLLTIKKGEIVSAEIFSVDKGEKGTPGQLNGRLKNNTIGEIKLNSKCGVYSVPTKNVTINSLTDIAFKSEVKNGDAKILCTVEGETPKFYSCKITLKKGKYNSPTQNMIVTVTDETLLERTGGIVQGLSGSPILQNGKLVGAVTRVLVDDPAKGYGIFAENMLENAKSVLDSTLREAS